MLIDWFTVGAQVLNFLILVWLLKRFLYKPILNAIDDREERIAKKLADADAKRAEAEAERERLKNKNEEFDRQRDALLSKAKDDAEAERQRLLAEARQAADDLRALRQDALKREQDSLLDEIILRTRQEVFAIARKALADLAGTDLEECMSEVFTRRLRELDAEAKKDLARALNTSSTAVVVRSAFDLPSEQQAAIQRAIHEAFSVESEVRFETRPDVISGIELLTNGRKVAWSIADYLASLEKNVGNLLKEQSKPRARPEATPEPSTESGIQPGTSEEAT